MSTDNPSGAATPSEGTASSTPPPATAGAPIAEINLVNQPELDRDPKVFGQTLTAGKKSADASLGGGTPSEVAYVAFTEKPYNADESRDATRQTITLWLIGLLCAVVGLTFVALFARGASTGFTDKEFFRDLKQVLDVLVGPVVTLLASAVGFYFGSKQGELAQQIKDNRSTS